MKNLISCLVALLFLWPISDLMAQAEPVPKKKGWGLKSIGFFATYGGERFLKPITFAQLARNSGAANSNLTDFFELPPGATDGGSRYLDDTPPLGLGFQVAWPVGKRHNEFRAGFSFQDHGHWVSVNSRYNISPDTIRFHSKSIRDEYLISQASFDFMMYSKPLLRTVRLLWRVGGTFGVSTRHDYQFEENIMDLDTADVFFGPGGSFGYNRQKAVIFSQQTSLGSNPRLEGGIRTSVGLEIILKIANQQIAFSGEYGYGLASQKVLKGGTTNYKRTELGHLQARIFLR